MEKNYTVIFFFELFLTNFCLISFLIVHCRDIKDKTVLKIYETDLPPGHYGSLSPSKSPKPVQQVPRPTSASAIYYTSDSELSAVRAGQQPTSRSPGHQAIYGTRVYTDVSNTGEKVFMVGGGEGRV